MKQIEPEIKKVKNDNKDNKQKQAEEIMKLYREHGINPYSGCLMLIIQLPILIALYRLFWSGVAFDETLLYPFISAPTLLKVEFLGLINITEISFLLAFLAGITQYYQIKLSMVRTIGDKEENKNIQKKPNLQEDFGKLFAKQSQYIMPLLIFFIASRFPSAVALYLTTMNIFAIFHESIVRKKALNISKANEVKDDN